jgi:hypothetical protein
LTGHCFLKRLILDLVNQDVPSPAKLPAAPDVKLSLVLGFALLKNCDVVGPANFSHKLCEFFIRAVHFVEVLHPPEVRGGKTIRRGKFLAKILCQIANNALSPGIPLLFLNDHPSDICIERNQLAVNGT